MQEPDAGRRGHIMAKDTRGNGKQRARIGPNTRGNCRSRWHDSVQDTRGNCRMLRAVLKA